MGSNVFEGTCPQWLRLNSSDRLKLNIRELGRYGSRDGQTEIDVIATDIGYLRWMADGRRLTFAR